jgi:hypothetical protein
MPRNRAAVLVSLLAAACASQALPPGGPVDREPPKLLSVSPDTSAVGVKPREVVFRFDKVISERPARGGTTLEQIITISPTEGPLAVDWRRHEIGVRPKKGWRANTSYTVTILPGLSDLRANAIKRPLQTVFSTGSVIPSGVVRGVVFDWLQQRPAAGARIEAVTAGDTVLRYLATADSVGRFALPHLPRGTWRVTAFVDQNSNRTLDRRREVWDSTTVAITDSVASEFYLFTHDSVGPRMSDVKEVDSLAIRVRFDRPLSPTSPLTLADFTLRRASDSTVIPLRAVLSAGAFDSSAVIIKQFIADSIARADTTLAGRRARARADSVRQRQRSDSISAAQQAAMKAARDTVVKEVAPKPKRRAPLNELVLQVLSPLPQNVLMRLQLKGATGLDGTRRDSERVLLIKPPAKKDSTTTKAPPARTPPAAAPARRPPA